MGNLNRFEPQWENGKDPNPLPTPPPRLTPEEIETIVVAGAVVRVKGIPSSPLMKVRFQEKNTNGKMRCFWFDSSGHYQEVLIYHGYLEEVVEDEVTSPSTPKIDP